MRPITSRVLKDCGHLSQEVMWMPSLSRIGCVDPAAPVFTLEILSQSAPEPQIRALEITGADQTRYLPLLQTTWVTLRIGEMTLNYLLYGSRSMPPLRDLVSTN